MRISDWSSDVCSSDLDARKQRLALAQAAEQGRGPAVDEALGEPLVERVRQLVLELARPLLPALRVIEPVLPVGDVCPGARSEERRVGKECVSTCRFRW